MQRAAFTIYLIILILSILLFGAMHTYVYTLMALGVLIATILVLIKNIRKNHRTGNYQVRFPGNSLNLIFFVLLVFLFFQIIPLPDFVLGVLSPEAAVVASKSLPASDSLGQGSIDKAWFALAPYSYPVRMSIIRFTVYGLFFFGLIQVLNSKKRIDLAISLILITGCFEALYGLIQTYSGSEHIWWFKKQAYRGDICGTYINRNHFAGFMEMGVLVAAAFTAALAPKRKKIKTGSDRKRSFSSRISEALSMEQEFTKRILILFTGVVLGIGLIFSASRGGMIAVAGALLLMGVLMVLRKGYRGKGYILLFLFLVISAYAIKIGVEYPLGRFKTFYSSLEARTRYAQKTIDMFEDYRLSGVGVGSFKYAYPKYQAPEDRVFIRFAHNDWAQYLAEAGIIGFCLLVIGISYYVFRTIKLWKKREDPYAVCLGVLPLVVLAAVGVHSYSDFNLHIPANFLILVAIMAIGYAALHLERHSRRDRMNYRYYELPLKYRGAVVLVLIFGLIGWSGYWTIKHFMAEAYCNTVPNSTLNRDPNPPVEEVVKAIEWDGSNAEYWYKLSNKLRDLGIEGLRDSRISRKSAETQRGEEGVNGGGKEGDDGYSLLVNRILEEEGMIDSRITNQQITNNAAKQLALERAVRLNPFEAQYHLQLGWAYARKWKEP
ncbi:MAG: O-antigen ligase family protein, partial [Pseudomonadota bacterium]